MGLSITFWFSFYGCVAMGGLSYLLFGIYRRRSRHSWIRGNYGIDAPWSILEYFAYTVASLISPFSLIFFLEFIWNPLHWLACCSFLILSWSIAFIPGFIFINIIYSSLVTKYDIINRMLHTISILKIENKKHPVTIKSNKTKEDEQQRVYKNEFVKSTFKYLDNPFKAWTGSEKVLDIGCGTGLLTTWIASKYIRDNVKLSQTKNNKIKELEQDVDNSCSNWGKVLALDLWETKDNNNNNENGTASRDQFGNSKNRIIENCEKENVSEFVKVIESDCRKLPFKSNTFDIVVSSLCIHNIYERDNSQYARVERSKAINEAVRVTKKGGIIAFYDIFVCDEYVQELINNKSVRCIDQSEQLPGFHQGHIITAFKV